MKIILKLLTAPLLMSCFIAVAQVKTNFNNKTIIDNHGRFIKPYKLQVDFQIPAKNIAELLQAEKLNTEKSNNEKPFQLAVAVPIDLNVAKLINWDYEKDIAYGKFTIKLNGALSSSINFDKFFLPKGTEMYIYNENGNMITGPVTKNENNSNKVWGSWVYQGSWLMIEIKTPLSTLDQFVLHSNNIAYGYKDVYAKVNGFGTSGPCEINVLCPLGNGWEGERNSVALVLSDNGQDWCSGCMIMNTCSTNRPFFLTANHCFTGQNVAAWRFTFQAWSATCFPSQNSDGVTYNGSTLRANYANSDFCLVELNNTPPTNSGISYAGWTRSATPAQNETGIHHPHGDVMKISRANNAVIRTAYGGGTGNDHWQVNWSPQNNGAGQIVTAVTEPGSSGSPLFDQNHRVIGQLHGGPSICGGAQLWDYYGCFDVSWTGGGTNATRLSNWLDPSNSGAMTTNTTNVNLLIPAILNPSLSGNSNLCSGTTTYTLNSNGISYTGNVSWTSSNSNIASITPNGNPATLTQLSSGTVTITASVCGTNISKTVYVGTPSINNFSFASNGPSCTNYDNQSMSFGVTYNGYYGCDLNTQAGITGVDWQISCPNPYTVTYNAGIYTCSNISQVNNAGVSVAFSYPSQPYVITFRFRVQTACGWSRWSPGYYQTINNCYAPSGITVSPNPANNTINISLNKFSTNNSLLEKDKNFSIKQIEITDKIGNVIRNYEYVIPAGSRTLDISMLKPDLYFIKVFTGSQWQSLSFIKR